MKARNWTAWERYLPLAKVETRTGAAVMCLEPWDLILSEEGVEERMAIKESFWRPWGRYLPGEGVDAAIHLPLGAEAERPEKVRV